MYYTGSWSLYKNSSFQPIYSSKIWDVLVLSEPLPSAFTQTKILLRQMRFDLYERVDKSNE
jgi:hypothetical protein